MMIIICKNLEYFKAHATFFYLVIIIITIAIIIIFLLLTLYVQLHALSARKVFAVVSMMGLIGRSVLHLADDHNNNGFTIFSFHKVQKPHFTHSSASLAFAESWRD